MYRTFIGFPFFQTCTVVLFVPIFCPHIFVLQFELQNFAIIPNFLSACLLYTLCYLSNFCLRRPACCHVAQTDCCFVDILLLVADF